MGSLLFTVYGFVSFNYCEVPRCSGDQCHEHLGSTYITKRAWKMPTAPRPSPQACWSPQGLHTQPSAGAAQQLSLLLFPAKSALLCLSKLLLFPGDCPSSPHAGSPGQPSPSRRSRLGAVRLLAPSFLLPFIFLRLLGSVLYNKVTCMANSTNVYQTWTCRSPPPGYMCTFHLQQCCTRPPPARSSPTPL